MISLGNSELQNESPVLSVAIPASSSRSSLSPSPFSGPSHALQAEVDQLRNQITSLETDNARLINEASSQQDLVRDTKKTLDDAQMRIEALEQSERRLSDVEATLERRDSELHEHKAMLEERLTLFQTLESSSEEMEHQIKASEDTIKLLERQINNLNDQFDKEKKHLGVQIDELRSAGQETIALYEDRLSAGETKRYELEDNLASMQDKLNAVARPLSPATMTRHASEAAQIDNETLREQAAHLQKRISKLEEALEDARASAESEESDMQRRVEKWKDNETQMRTEMDLMKRAVEEARRTEGKTRERVEELEVALKENAAALEDARADVEGLRSELAVSPKCDSWC
jgi:chromosome segregation ATPase